MFPLVVHHAAPKYSRKATVRLDVLVEDFWSQIIVRQGLRAPTLPRLEGHL